MDFYFITSFNLKRFKLTSKLTFRRLFIIFHFKDWLNWVSILRSHYIQIQLKLIEIELFRN